MRFSDPDYASQETTTLWRLAHPDGATVRAAIIPGFLQQTLAWFVDDVLDRVENFNDTASALARSAGSRQELMDAGWKEVD